MLNIHFRSPALWNRQRDFYGYGRVFFKLREALLQREDVRLVEDYKHADIQVCLCHPHQRWEYFHWWGHERHPVQVIYTTWETTRLPLDWHEVLNSCAGVFTVSDWSVGVYRNDGITAQLFNVPHGVDTEYFKYLERDWQSERFYFLWQGMYFVDRKGLKWARQAFTELNLPNAWLVEKWYPMISRAWGPVRYDAERRIQIGQFLEKDDYHDLLRSCHVSVNPTRGEGFGMLPLETASTGMATIVTDWSGVKEYVTPECFWPLKYKLCEPGQDYVTTYAYALAKTKPGQDAIPDVEDLKKAMLYFYENREAAREMGLRAHEHAKQFTWARAAQMFVDSCHAVLESGAKTKDIYRRKYVYEYGAPIGFWNILWWRMERMWKKVKKWARMF